MDEIACPLREAAQSAPDRAAIISPERRLTFRELDEWVEGTSAHLGRSGDRMALWMDNDWRMIVLLLAAARAGVVACPLSTRLPSVNDALDQIGARLLVSDRHGTAPDDLLERSRAGGEIIHPPEQPATIVYTSGSSGRPKAALLSFGNHYYSALGSNSNITVETGDRWLLSLPLYHVGGIAIVFRCLLGRGTIVLGESLHEGVKHVTHVSLVATQLLRLLRSDVDISHLKAVLLGGSAIPPSLIDDAFQRGLPIHTSYGMTEMGSQVTASPPGASREVLATSGRVLPNRELRVTTEGEIQVRGRTRFLGYVERAGLAKPFDDDGWYATGDTGHMEDDLLRVTGRMDNMFISGGENVMPEEIELIIASKPGVKRTVVVPVEDEEFGRRPVAFVDTGAEALNPPEIEAWLEARVPRFKIPIRYFVWPERADASGMKLDRGFFQREAGRLMQERNR